MHMTSTPIISHVFIAGAGLMGQGIAQVTATAGLQVTLYDISADALRAALEKIRWSLDKLHAKGRIAEPPDTILARITTTDDLSRAADADLVIEAAPERETLKRELFSKLDQLCPPSVLFASNTSAIPITKLAA